MTATRTVASSAAEARPTRVPGEPGVWILILGDLIVFGVLFVAFMHTRGAAPEMFNRSQLTLHRAFGGVNTLLLLTSSLLVVLAVGAIRSSVQTTARRCVYGALGCAAVFLLDKGVEWTALITGGHGPSSNAYFTFFFVLAGLHAAHVILGAIFLSVLVATSPNDNLDDVQIAMVESYGCFWHLVDMLWLIIFSLLYLMH